MSILADARQLNDRVISHTGPASYVTFVSPTTGGDILLASESANKTIYHVEDAVTADGLYYVIPVNSATGPLGGGQATMILIWFVVLTNAQVANGVNLSGSSVALRVLGV